MKPEPRKPFGTTIRPSLHKQLTEYCQPTGTKVWVFVERALRHELDRTKEAS